MVAVNMAMNKVKDECKGATCGIILELENCFMGANTLLRAKANVTMLNFSCFNVKNYTNVASRSKAFMKMFLIYYENM
jgi:hypothetical protein